VHLGKILIVN